MSNLLFTGFNGITTAQLTRRFPGANTSQCTVGTSYARFSGENGLRLTANNCFPLQLGTGEAEIIMGFHWKCVSTSGSDRICYFYHTTQGVHGELQCNLATGKITMLKASGLLAGTSLATVTSGVWYWIEVGFKVSDTVGTLTLKIDGVPQFAITGADTKAGSGTVIETIYFGSNSLPDQNITNLYLNTPAGIAPHNTFWGETRITRVDTLANSTPVDFTPLSGTNESNIDDGDTPDDDSTYNSGSNVADRDLFTVSGYTAPSSTILGVAVRATMKKTDVNARTANTVLKSSSTVVQGTPIGLSTGYQEVSQYAYTDPATAAAFANSAAINAVKIGYEIAS